MARPMCLLTLLLDIGVWIESNLDNNFRKLKCKIVISEIIPFPPKKCNNKFFDRIKTEFGISIIVPTVKF